MTKRKQPNPDKNRYSKAPRSAWVDAHSVFAMGTTHSGETKPVGKSKKRPGKLKWPERLGSDHRKDASPSVTGRSRLQQSRLLSQRYAEQGGTPTQAALKEQFGGYRQSFK